MSKPWSSRANFAFFLLTTMSDAYLSGIGAVVFLLGVGGHSDHLNPLQHLILSQNRPMCRLI